MINKRLFFVLILIIVAFGAISCVSAEDINTNGRIGQDIAICDNVETIDGGLSAFEVDDDILNVEENGEERTDLKENENITPEIQETNATLSITNLTDYYKTEKNVTISLVNSENGEPIKGEILKVYIPFTADEYYYVATNNDGKSILTVDKLIPGTYEIYVTLNNTDYIKSNIAYGKVIIKPIPITLKASKLTTTYNSGKNFQIKVLDNNNKAVGNLKLKLKVYTGSSFVTKYVTTNSNGIANYKTSGLKKGTHKIVIISTDNNYSAKSISSSIVINAKKLYILGEANTYKNCGQLILGAYDKTNDKLISGVKLQIKIYTGKKYRTFNLVTKYSKDIKLIGVLIETNAFTVGTHKVTVKIISPTNYKGSETGDIKIPKSSKKYSKFTYVITNGKGKYV